MRSISSNCGTVWSAIGSAAETMPRRRGTAATCCRRCCAGSGDNCVLKPLLVPAENAIC